MFYRFGLRWALGLVGLVLAGAGCGSLESGAGEGDVRPALSVSREVCAEASRHGRRARESASLQAAGHSALNYFSIVPDQPPENWWWSPRMTGWLHLYINEVEVASTSPHGLIDVPGGVEFWAATGDEVLLTWQMRKERFTGIQHGYADPFLICLKSGQGWPGWPHAGIIHWVPRQGSGGYPTPPFEQDSELGWVEFGRHRFTIPALPPAGEPLPSPSGPGASPSPAPESEASPSPSPASPSPSPSAGPFPAPSVARRLEIQSFAADPASFDPQAEETTTWRARVVASGFSAPTLSYRMTPQAPASPSGIPVSAAIIGPGPGGNLLDPPTFAGTADISSGTADLAEVWNGRSLGNVTVAAGTYRYELTVTVTEAGGGEARTARGFAQVTVGSAKVEFLLDGQPVSVVRPSYLWHVNQAEDVRIPPDAPDPRKEPGWQPGFPSVVEIRATLSSLPRNKTFPYNVTLIATPLPDRFREAGHAHEGTGGLWPPGLLRVLTQKIGNSGDP